MSSIVYGKTIQKIVCLNVWAELRSPNTRMLKMQFWNFEMKCRLEHPLGILNLNSTFIRPVKTDLMKEYERVRKRSRKKQQHSLRNEKLKANRASVTEEQRRERLRIRREKDRASVYRIPVYLEKVVASKQLKFAMETDIE